jgi:hypothetical protein
MVTKGDIHKVIKELIELEKTSPKGFIEEWVQSLELEKWGCPIGDTSFFSNQIPSYQEKTNKYQEICRLMEEYYGDYKETHKFTEFDDYLKKQLKKLLKNK